jgi:hypothetical protein
MATLTCSFHDIDEITHVVLKVTHSYMGLKVTHSYMILKVTHSYMGLKVTCSYMGLKVTRSYMGLKVTHSYMILKVRIAYHNIEMGLHNDSATQCLSKLPSGFRDDFNIFFFNNSLYVRKFKNKSKI